MTSNYILLCVFAIIAYVMIVDANVSEWIWLQLKLLYINCVRYWFILTIGIRVKIDNWKLKKELKKIRKEYNIK